MSDEVSERGWARLDDLALGRLVGHAVTLTLRFVATAFAAISGFAIALIDWRETDAAPNAVARSTLGLGSRCLSLGRPRRWL
jgi:hypothetical protein